MDFKIRLVTLTFSPVSSVTDGFRTSATAEILWHFFCGPPDTGWFRYFWTRFHGFHENLIENLLIFAQTRWSSTGHNFFHRRRRLARLYIFEMYSSRSLQKYILLGVTDHSEKIYRGVKLAAWGENPDSRSAPPHCKEQGLDWKDLPIL